MAIFQKIRDKSLLSLIVIGGGILLFILQGALEGSSSTIDDHVGNFEGKDISQAEFDSYFSTILYLNGNKKTSSSLTDQEKQQYSAQTWNQLILAKVFDSEGDNNGINITDGEFEEMLVGENVSQYFVNFLFGGGQNYQNVRKDLNEDVENYLEYDVFGDNDFKSEEVKHFGLSLRKQDKIKSIIKNSFFTTTSESLDLYKGKYSSKNVTIGTVPYYLVPDSLIEVNDAEIKDFYKKNKGKYKQLNPSKKVIYGSYRVDPTPEDDQEVVIWAKETVKLFTEEENDKTFIATESETKYDNEYYKRGGGLVNELDNILFEKEKGFVYGPYSGYIDGNKTYNVAKILDVQHMPDSAKVAQILLTPEKRIQALIAINSKPEQEEVNEMWKGYDDYVDSIYNALLGGASFPIAAVALSDDSLTSIKGGDLGWIQESSNQYAPQFLDSVFMESKSEKAIKKVQVFTDGGRYYYYQIVKVREMGKKSKKIKVGIVSKSVLPSNKTRDGFFNRINQAALALNNGLNLTAVKDSFNLTIDSSKVEPQQYLVNDLKGARSLVYWAFNTAKDKKCKVFDFDRKYVVALVVEESEKGFKTLEDEEVKKEIREKVRKNKKAAYIANEIGDVNDATLTDLTKTFNGATLESMDNVNLSQGVAKLNFESSLNGVISSLEIGGVSSVITGLDGAYIVKVNSGIPATVTDDTNLELELNELNQQNGNKTEFVLQELIIENAEVEDNRSTLQ
jgi:peptidyl-prolyl cis-trans isomerase D